MVEGEALQCVLFVDHLNVYDKCLRSRLGSGGSGVDRPATKHLALQPSARCWSSTEARENVVMFQVGVVLQNGPGLGQVHDLLQQYWCSGKRYA